MSYARAGNWVGCVKSTLCQWLRKAPLTVPQLPPDGTLELDGLWTRTRSGRTELVAHRTTSRLERHNRELRRREQLRMVWTERNLLALLPERNLINQTT